VTLKKSKKQGRCVEIIFLKHLLAILADFELYHLPIAPPLKSVLRNHPFLLDIGLTVEVMSSPYFWVIVDDESDDLKKEA
jgi:hypothetical protein